MFPFAIAKKLPVYFYGSVKFASLKGSVQIEAPIKRGMIGFGKAYEMSTRSMRIAEIVLNGQLIFKGHVQFGKDYFIFIGTNAYCEFGNMASLASRGKIICTDNIVLGDFARIGSESQIIDTNFHQMVDTITLERFPKTSPISIGNYNFIGNRVSIMSKSKTSDYCTIASNTVCNKDYSDLGQYILIGGIPAKLLKKNISRDWNGEMDNLLRNLTV